MSNRGLVRRMLRIQLKNHNFVGRTWCRTMVLGPVAPKVLALVGLMVLEHGVLYRRKGFALPVVGVLLLGAKWVARSSNNRGFYVLV